MYKLIFIALLSINIYASQCASYFSPEKFYKAPSYLIELLNSKKDYIKVQEFDIIKKEIYRFRPEEIANTINDDFEGYWSDWTGDAYELYLKPEYTRFKYKDFYFSLKVLISGVVGDATNLKGTMIKYHIYNYTNKVNKFIKCQERSKD